MQNNKFFGYGSLVNAQTHDYPNAKPAQLDGWRRTWVHTNLRPFLSVAPGPGAIDGLIADVPGADWAALDHRERAYDKHPVNVMLHDCGTESSAQVYAVPHIHAAPPDTLHPVLLSYIDVVVQGYLQVFGEAGAIRFFETTDGWDAPILNDRAAPVYTRNQVLSEWETGFVDAWLAELSAVVPEAHEPPLTRKGLGMR